MASLMRHRNGSLFDSLAESYDAWFEEDGKRLFAVEVNAFQEILTLLPKPWLEVGVGSGRFAQALGIENGIDPSVKLLEIETFGAVFLIVTLCFVDSPIVVLREAHRILKPEGKIVLGLVLRESPWGKSYQIKKLEGHRFYKHATFYSYQEVKKLLMDSGFNIEEVVSTLFQKPGEVKEMEPPKKGFSIDAGFTVIVARKIPYPKER